MGGGGAKYRPDWQCPTCAHVNFARRQACENCNTPRTDNAMPAYAPQHQAVQEGSVAATQGTPLMKAAAGPGRSPSVFATHLIFIRLATTRGGRGFFITLARATGRGFTLPPISRDTVTPPP